MEGEKKVLRRLMEMIMLDTRSVTGRNLRHLNLMTENCDTSQLDVYSKPYKAIPIEDEWRVPFVQELMNAKKTGPFDEITREDLNEICDYVCQS